MKLSERIRNAGVGTFQEMWNGIADEVAQLEAESEALRIDIAILEASWDGAIRRTGEQDGQTKDT